jgi:TolB-like protein/DNA-binding winged helix-turn-helix (wHTH) protein/tetratricopeptide (TPR) repeat protein
MEGPRQLYNFPPFLFDSAKHVLLRGGERVPLTQKALATLLVLLERPGRTVSKEELMDRVWPGTAVEENNLNQCISAIRKALGEQRDDHRFILTVPGKGYRFVAYVREHPNGSPPQPVQENGYGMLSAALLPLASAASRLAGSAPGSESPEACPSSPLSADSPVRLAATNRSRFIATCAVGVLTALAITATLRIPGSGPRSQAAASVPSVAVLPFLNLAGSSENDYLSDGFTEELTTDLAQIQGLRVVARTSAFQFRGRADDVRRIGQQLNVGAVLEGSVSRSGAKLHVTAQLISTQNGYHLWSHAFDGEPGQIYTIQQGIVGETTRILGVPFGERSLSSTHRQTNPEAHDLYLRGRYFWSKRDVPDMERAVELFKAATEKDPNFALAYAGLADTYVVLGGNAQKPLSEVVPPAKAAMVRALELDPDLAEAHATLALLNSESSGERRGLEPELRRAVELSPSYATAHHWLGAILSAYGRFEEADLELRKAQLLDPLSPMIRQGLAENFYMWRRYDDAIDQVHRIQEMGSSVGDYVLGHAYIQKAMYPEAIALFQRLREGGDSGAVVQLSVAYAATADQSEARELLRQATSLQHGYVPPYWMAVAYLRLGEKDTAFRWLQRAHVENDPSLVWMKVDPMLDPLRSDPRYTQLLRKADLSN